MAGPNLAREGRACGWNLRLKDGGVGMAWALGADGGDCQSWLAGHVSGESGQSVCFLLYSLPSATRQALLWALGIYW